MESRFIRKYKEFINESHSEDKLIIPKGEVLFHSSVEDFSAEDLTTGGYDNILWTAKESAISQSYIPVSGSTMFARTKSFHGPSYNEGDRDMQKQLGVNYDYSKVKFDDNKRAVSWSTPDEWKEESDKAYKWSETFHNLKKELDKTKKEYIDLSDEYMKKYKSLSDKEKSEMKSKLNELFSKSSEMEKKYNEMQKEYFDKGSSEKYELETINKELKKLGYKPVDVDENGKNHSWELKTGYDENKKSIILPADYRAEGRLFIIKPKEDLKIYDYAKGREGDLTDLDYHKLDLFEEKEKKGYDGVKINDFAQIEGEGNFGHTSIGLFKSTIPKLDIISIPASHPEDFYNNHVKNRDYDSKEYKEYIS